MKDFPFRLEPLSAEHDRGSFHCGEEVLDRYLQTQATQDIRRRIANCLVAIRLPILTAGKVGYLGEALYLGPRKQPEVGWPPRSCNTQRCECPPLLGFRPLDSQPRTLFLPLGLGERRFPGVRASFYHQFLYATPPVDQRELFRLPGVYLPSKVHDLG